MFHHYISDSCSYKNSENMKYKREVKLPINFLGDCKIFVFLHSMYFICGGIKEREGTCNYVIVIIKYIEMAYINFKSI